jgi:hypothetical protein
MLEAIIIRIRKETYKNIMTMTKGMRKISVKDTSRRMLTDWNSTREMSILAPHHEF